MAAAADVPRLATSATARIPDVREGTPWPQPRPASVSARDMDLSAGGLLARARGATRTVAGPAAARQERDDDRLDYFLRGLPDWMRVAVELRHHSWAVDPVFDLLSRHHATYVVMSGAGLPCVLRATSTTVYVRLHGPDHDHLYAGSYGEADLYWWADRIREWHRQHLGVFAYFNNDGYGHAVTNARRLRTLTNS